MKQVVIHTSTYSSDTFGVCSALYELGGMVVMHDASGCNSTYTTHDEPRWYDMDSMVYISALSEMEAILGDDAKLIRDLTEAANELKPEFIALAGTPIPYMTGTDFTAVAAMAEKETGIPCFGFQTNGMAYYTKGVSMALQKLAEQFCTEAFEKPVDKIRVNILGATPLDFSVGKTVKAIRSWLEEKGCEAGACFAMGSTLEEIRKASSAHVNLVISYGGLAAAGVLRERFGIPYIAGVPYGKLFSGQLKDCIDQTARTGTSVCAYDVDTACESASKKQIAIIGESVAGASLAAAIELEHPDISCYVLCPVDTEPVLLRSKDLLAPEEEDVVSALRNMSAVIADPLYRPLCPDKEFIALPHTAFSGRIYEKEFPVLIGDISALWQ